MTALWQDLRFAGRMLRKSPGFTAIALVTLAIGIGANTIVFGVANVLLLRPPLVEAPDRLAVCDFRDVRASLPYSAYLMLRDNNPAFDGLAACSDSGYLTLVRGDSVRRVSALYVSANYFSVLGVLPFQGRGFLPEEERHGAEPVAVLSYRAWQRYGADPNIVGTYIAANGTPFRIVGVAPKRFTGTAILGPDLWLPLGSYGPVGNVGWEKPARYPDEFWNYPRSMVLVGRLRPGLTMAEAQARLQSAAAYLKANYARWWGSDGALSLARLPRLTVESSYDRRTDMSLLSLLLIGVSAAVLLIACLNVANIAVVRGAARQREIAIRMALGSGRLRIVRQLLLESLFLATLGGALGLVLAVWGSRVLNAWVGALKDPIDLAGSLKTGVDVRALAATVGFSLVAALLAGLRPAFRLSHRQVAADLKESRGETLRLGGKVRRTHGLSAVCQIALSVVLVMGASLFTRSAVQTAGVESAFNLDGGLLIELDPLAAGYDRPGAQRIYQTLVERLQGIPTVQAVGLSDSFPFSPYGGGGATVHEYAPAAAADQRSEGQMLRDMRTHPPVRTDTEYTVGPGYLAALGLPLLQGRPLDRLDGAPNAEKVVVIDERIARRLRPDGRALDCLVQKDVASPSSPYRVVGIVPHVPTISDERKGRGQIYVPLRQDRLPAQIHLRVAPMTRGTEAALIRQIHTEIHRVDPRLPIISVRTMADHCRNNLTLWAAGIGARLAATFGGMALFLASLGIYAVKGYMVASRTAEIGMRKALGATHGSIMGMVLREGLVLTLTGMLVGLLLGSAATRLVSSLLYGVRPVDPVSIIVTVILLGAASLLASYIPARRAARVDPMVALRCE